jgi:uncharacterized protein (UPF0548 family)
MTLRVSRRSSSDLSRLLAFAEAKGLTYDHIGSTLDPEEQARASVRRHRRDIGNGDGAFIHARDALRAWAPQRKIGGAVHPPDTPIEEGAAALVVLRLGPIEVTAPTRIVAVVDEPTRFGYAYGTLRGHPASGEESFLVELTADGVVRATIAIDAVSAIEPRRLITPVMRVMQAAIARRYITALI